MHYSQRTYMEQRQAIRMVCHFSPSEHAAFWLYPNDDWDEMSYAATRYHLGLSKPRYPLPAVRVDYFPMLMAWDIIRPYNHEVQS